MSVLFVGSVAVAGFLALIWAFQRTLIYFPFGDVPTPPAVGLPQAEVVTFPTPDGLTLNGWFVPSSGTSGAYTVLVLNGNAGNRASRAPLAQALRERGLQVLLFDYRGYGGSEGKPTEAGLRADAAAARRYLEQRNDVDVTRLVYLGESLGTAPAVALAADQPPAGLILRSPFPSLVEVGRLHYPFLPVRFLLQDRFVAMGDIADVSCPVLVLAGDQDRVIPLALSRQMYEAATSTKEFLILPGSDHNDFELLAGDRMIGAISQFVGRL